MSMRLRLLVLLPALCLALDVPVVVQAQRRIRPISDVFVPLPPPRPTPPPPPRLPTWREIWEIIEWLVWPRNFDFSSTDFVLLFTERHDGSFTASSMQALTFPTPLNPGPPWFPQSGSPELPATGLQVEAGSASAPTMDRSTSTLTKVAEVVHSLGENGDRIYRDRTFNTAAFNAQGRSAAALRSGLVDLLDELTAIPDDGSAEQAARKQAAVLEILYLTSRLDELCAWMRNYRELLGRAW